MVATLLTNRIITYPVIAAWLTEYIYLLLERLPPPPCIAVASGNDVQGAKFIL